MDGRDSWDLEHGWLQVTQRGQGSRKGCLCGHLWVQVLATSLGLLGTVDGRC